MFLKRMRPTLSQDFVASARAYALDVASSMFLFVCASIMAGRVWRFAFDDELLTPKVAEFSQSALDFLVFFIKGGDIHPPLAFLGFFGLLQLGFPDWAIRLCSLAMTGLALALFHTFCLTLLAQRSGSIVRSATRLMAILLFGLCPLAVSQGDAIRWYPPFAAFVALFVVFYLAGTNPAARLYSAVALGLAASTNFLAIFVAMSLLLYRYVLEQQFRFSFDIAYWLIVTVFASLGLVTAYSIAMHSFGQISDQQVGLSYLRVAATNALGFFGGDAVGIGYAWILVPIIAIAAFAIVSAIDRECPANPTHLLLLMLGALPIMTFADFVSPRSFLYLAPVFVTILILFLNRQGIDRGTGRAMLMAVLVFVPSIGVIANINQGNRPFKRNAVIPFQQVIDFIKANGTGNTLVMSTDPVLAWLLQHDRAQPKFCASYFMRARRCFSLGRIYDSIFIVSGHSSRSRDEEFMRTYQAEVMHLIAGKRKMSSMPVGLDKDAALKEWLTNTRLDKYILTVDHYQ
jgi:hypothetical protein